MADKKNAELSLANKYLERIDSVKKMQAQLDVDSPAMKLIRSMNKAQFDVDSPTMKLIRSMSKAQFDLDSPSMKLIRSMNKAQFDMDSPAMKSIRAMNKINGMLNMQIGSVNLRSDMNTLEGQVSELKRELNEKAEALINAQSELGTKEVELGEFAEKYKELLDKQDIAHLINHVGELGAKKLLSDPAFKDNFQNSAPAYVLAIDIRRSTELMLKARTPQKFASFITTLTMLLRECVLDNFGVFDKFTGDGILATFPEFFSGEDAGYHAINTAMQCHQIFEEVYREHRNCFVAVLKDVGLGIGVDYGEVQFVEISTEFTVVGTPVVYACRMSGAPACQTLLNQPAYEQLFGKYFVFDFEEGEIEVKHEGGTVAYRVRQNGKRFEPATPAWTSGVSTVCGAAEASTNK